jgi:hypothetical protein
VLQSPQAGVVPGLRKGDPLALHLTGGGAPVVAVDQAGRTAGSIVIRDMAILLNCMKAGRRFVAEVLQVGGGAVTVRVHAEGA